jgi:tripartite-type tricarboxylate transporter receptor subunit TctC
MKKNWTAGAITLAFSLIAGADVSAQAASTVGKGSGRAGEPYPSRPVRIIVPFPPGGAVDIVNRIVGSRLTDVLGQQVVIENRSGAGGNLGADIAAKSTPDGYTLFACGVASHGVSPAIYKKLPFDAVKDFAPISMIGTTPNVLVVHPAVPVRTVAEFIAYAKSAAGKVPFASPGVGTSPHMTMELFKIATGISLVHVAYKGGAPALQDVMGGHVVGMFGNLPEQLAAIKAGRTRALAVSSLKRHPALPDVPTVAESGVAGFEVTAWYASCVPAAVPRPILDKLNAALVKTLHMPEIRDRLVQSSIDVAPSTRDELAAFIKDEIAKWKKVAQSAGISLD